MMSLINIILDKIKNIDLKIENRGLKNMFSRKMRRQNEIFLEKINKIIMISNLK